MGVMFDKSVRQAFWCVEAEYYVHMISVIDDCPRIVSSRFDRVSVTEYQNIVELGIVLYCVILILMII